jgi:hypothetical protein
MNTAANECFDGDIGPLKLLSRDFLFSCCLGSGEWLAYARTRTCRFWRTELITAWFAVNYAVNCV